MGAIANSLDRYALTCYIQQSGVEDMDRKKGGGCGLLGGNGVRAAAFEKSPIDRLDELIDLLDGRLDAPLEEEIVVAQHLRGPTDQLHEFALGDAAHRGRHTRRLARRGQEHFGYADTEEPHRRLLAHLDSHFF